jgi:hypothetical protein
MNQPEVWLRGPVAGVPPILQPVAHALLQVAEDVPATVAPLAHEQTWLAVGASAPIGYHVGHLSGSIDRLFTYARGEQLSEAQRELLSSEKTLFERKPSSGELLDRLATTIHAALEQLRSTDAESLYVSREVGRGRLPSTQMGLLFHAAEHASRHAGQIATLSRIVSAAGALAG